MRRGLAEGHKDHNCSIRFLTARRLRSIDRTERIHYWWVGRPQCEGRLVCPLNSMDDSTSGFTVKLHWESNTTN